MRRKFKTLMQALKFYAATAIISKLPSFRMRHCYYRYILKYHIGKESSIHMGFFPTGLNINIGDNVVVNRNVYIDGRIGVTVKNNVSISPEVYIVSMEHEPNDPMFKTRGGEVVIDDNVWIGVRAVILPGVHIFKGAVIGAGAVVTRDVEPYAIMAGVPAKRIGERNKNIRYRCKYFPWFDTDIQR